MSWRDGSTSIPDMKTTLLLLGITLMIVIPVVWFVWQVVTLAFGFEPSSPIV